MWAHTKSASLQIDQTSSPRARTSSTDSNRFVNLLLAATLFALTNGCGGDRDGPTSDADIPGDADVDEDADGPSDADELTDAESSSPDDADVDEDADDESDADVDDGCGDVTFDGRCNGSSALCERRYDEVAYATTHNAMSNAEEGWVAPNQNLPIARQLDDGIRGLMLDTHYNPNEDDEPSLCHGDCLFGSTPLVEGFTEIYDFMVCHPGEIITIIFEPYITPEDTRLALEASGLINLVHVQEVGAAWPTLGEMVESAHRLVLLTGEGGGAWPGYLDVWDFAWETHYHAETPDDFSCTINRGERGNSLFIFNHFLTNPVARPELAESVNHNPFFWDRIELCRDDSGSFPNFITVDFYDIGDVLENVSSLNGM